MWPLLEGATSIAPDPAVLRSWRAAGGPFHAVVVAINDPRVEQRRIEVARALHPWLQRTCPGQAHVTVAALGGARPALEPRAVELEVSGADSFSSAAFLHAHGPGLADLREQLAGQEVDAPDEYVGHVTVGIYRWPLAAGIVAGRLAPWRHSRPLAVRGTVRLVRIDPASRTGRLIGAAPRQAAPVRPDRPRPPANP